MASPEQENQMPSIDAQRLQTNWTLIQSASPRVDGQVSFDLQPWGDDLYQNFDISCTGQNGNRPCSGHINMKASWNPSHVTLNGWNGDRKTNYWFEVDTRDNVSDGTPG